MYLIWYFQYSVTKKYLCPSGYLSTKSRVLATVFYKKIHLSFCCFLHNCLEDSIDDDGGGGGGGDDDGDNGDDDSDRHISPCLLYTSRCV